MCCTYALAELGHTQAELADLCDRARVRPKILARRRALTVEMIHKISEWVRKFPLTARSALPD